MRGNVMPLRPRRGRSGKRVRLPGPGRYRRQGAVAGACLRVDAVAFNAMAGAAPPHRLAKEIS
ncbi:hypothetical protein AB0D27_37595 [Streptomyces sp. NPDC048415]|uniref:hypothetical protein n=1 Tax=Streptomyces sp. NPDC048415 TaxID=3154822 RepID=UPI00341BD679